MQVTRRTLLAASSAMALTHWAGGVRSQSGMPGQLFVLLRGIGSLPDAETAIACVEAFTARQLPIVVALDRLDDAPWPDGALSGLIAAIAPDRGLVEVALEHRPRDLHHRYLQVRAAVDLKSRLSARFGRIDPRLADTVISILTDTEAPAIDPYAYGAAGFRVEIRLAPVDADRETMFVDPVDWGLLQIGGGFARPVDADPSGALAEMTQDGAVHLLVLDLQGQGREAAARCDLWAGSLDAEVTTGRRLMSRPRDYLLQGNPGVSKYLALVLDGPLDAPGSALAADLARLEIPLTITGAAPPDPLPPLTGFCGVGSGLPDEGPGAACLRLSPGDAIAGEARRARIVLTDTTPVGPRTGPQPDGRFHAMMEGLPEFGVLEAIDDHPMTNAVLRIAPEEIDTPIKRATLARRAGQAAREGRVNFVTVEGLRDALSPPDPVLRRFWSTRDRFLTLAPRQPDIDTDERARLMADARTAWSYVARFTDDRTGLCAGTVQSSPGFDLVNSEVTLWDVASQIRAIMAADALGLIEVSEARGRIARAIAATPVVTIGSLRLPPAIFSAASGRATRISFDACDTGRFLLTLRDAVSGGFATGAAAQALLERWDLAGAVRDGHPFSHVLGHWVDTFTSHCTDYITGGYAFAGIDVASPYPALGPDPDGDARIALLHAAGDIGHFGPEPALLSAVENEQSPEMAYLSDVLFDAQLGWFEKTGIYRCVSELPVNVAPWFIYQGLRVDLPEPDAWVVVAPATPDRDASGLADADPMRLISTKSAFLWAATHDHPYSRAILRIVRDRARIDGLGFSAGLYEDGLDPLSGYTDLNTNGIILTAIAHMLRP